jgi:multidrug transporter EmrE-like cation transporter
MDFSTPESNSTSEPAPQDLHAAPQTAGLTALSRREAATESEGSSSGSDARTASTQKRGERPRKHNYAVGLFIGLLALFSILSLVAVVSWIWLPENSAPFDWLGLLVLCSLIVVSEGFSIDLYFRQNSVSTSALPILVAYLVFGPVGIVCASLILAIALIIKYRSRFSRFVFNFSNHILAGSL